MWQQRRKRRRTHAGLGKKGSGQKGCGTFLHQAGLHTHTGTGKELDQLPVYAKKIGKMLRELKKYTGAASEEIQKNVVEPLNEIQAPLKEAVAPLTDIKKDIDNSVKDVTKGFTGIGKTSKEEAAKKAAEEEVTDLTAEEPVEELPEENAAPAAEPAAEKAKAPAEEKPETAPVQEETAPAPEAPAAEAAPEAAEAAPAEETTV